MSYNVLIINYYYPPINNGGVQRTYNFRKYLMKMGFDVTFITTNSYGVVTSNDETSVLRFSDKGYDYTHSKKSSKIGVFLFRSLRLILVKLGIITDGKYFWEKEVINNIDKKIENKKFDVVVASYPTPANLEIGEYIHRHYGVPLVVDYRDGLMFEPFDQIKNSFFICKLRLEALEKRMAEYASLHITVNDEMNQYYENKYPDVRSVVIPNGFDDEEDINALPLKLPEGVNVLYTGAIGKSRVMYSNDELKEFLSNLFDITPDVNYVFVGEYTNDELEILKAHKNVFTYKKTDRNVVIATQKMADALLLISGPNGGTSGKLYEYLFSGKPILNIGGSRGIASLIDGKHFGVTYSPDDLIGMKCFIEKLKNRELEFAQGDLTPYTRRYQCELLAKEIIAIINPNNR